MKNIVKLNESSLNKIVTECVRKILKERTEQELTNKIFACLENAYSHDYIDDMTSLRDLFVMKFDILKYAFTDEEIWHLPKDVIKSTFSRWYGMNIS